MKNSQSDRLDVLAARPKACFEPIREIYIGVRTNTIPWPVCAGWAVFSSFLLFFKIDLFLISKTKLILLYPYFPPLYKAYAFFLSTAAFWVWAVREVKRKKDRLKLLTNAFKNAGLESRIGRLPHLISDHSLDQTTRKMRLTNAGFPVSVFRQQSKYIESELGIFIDEIKETRERRAIDILYSHFPMASEVRYAPELAGGYLEFLIGQTRSSVLTSSFKDSPHLLVAGQTGGGKSTFLRQFIVHTALQAKETKFLLVDLKGGLEFSIFENRKRFVVVPHVLAAVEELKKIDKVLDFRMAFLKEHNCKDIDDYRKKQDKPAGAPNLERQVVVVDEAAEMFLAGYHAKAQDIQAARAILSRIARQGRAVGVHLVVATQRPDSRSLDPQVKANLTGVICFQMMNDASSIAVLGNGRATDLPKIPGRAIWKNGIELLEVQTPLLTVEDAEALLGPADDEPAKIKAASVSLQLVSQNSEVGKTEALLTDTD